MATNLDGRALRVMGVTLHKVEVGHHKGHQICAHSHSGREMDTCQSTRQSLVLADVHIGQGDVISVSYQRNVEDCFHGRLVKTREGLPGVGWFKLCCGQHTAVAQPTFTEWDTYTCTSSICAAIQQNERRLINLCSKLSLRSCWLPKREESSPCSFKTTSLQIPQANLSVVQVMYHNETIAFYTCTNTISASRVHSHVPSLSR